VHSSTMLCSAVRLCQHHFHICNALWFAVLMLQVEALLDRAHGGPPPVSWVVQQLESLGYNSWAHRIICSAGEPFLTLVSWCKTAGAMI
jgi:hypothetical protein